MANNRVGVEEALLPTTRQLSPFIICILDALLRVTQDYNDARVLMTAHL